VLYQKIIATDAASGGSAWAETCSGRHASCRCRSSPTWAWSGTPRWGSILFGHIVERVDRAPEALRVFRSRREATLSQLPRLMMMLFTTVGLWILAQLIQGDGP
jgi:hypothetical protein